MATRIGEGHALCRRCDKIKPVTEFHRNKATNTGIACYCKECYKLPNTAIVHVCGQDTPQYNRWNYLQRLKMSAVDDGTKWATRVYVCDGQGRFWRWRHFRHTVANNIQEFLGRMKKEKRFVKYVGQGSRQDLVGFNS